MITDYKHINVRRCTGPEHIQWSQQQPEVGGGAWEQRPVSESQELRGKSEVSAMAMRNEAGCLPATLPPIRSSSLLGMLCLMTSILLPCRSSGLVNKYIVLFRGWDFKLNCKLIERSNCVLGVCFVHGPDVYLYSNGIVHGPYQLSKKLSN